MAKVTMRLEGMETLQRALTRAPQLVAVHAGDAVAVSSFAVAQRARAIAPRRSGALKEAITATSRGLSGRVGVASKPSATGDPSRYWRFVEFGTVRTSAQPFFRPAADQESSTFIQRIRAIGPKLERDLSTGRFL